MSKNRTETIYTGFLNIYKEAGFTSHDVVAKLRGLLRQRKIGHMGTLDPNACGVLPVALGKATKAISLLEDHSKEYEACMLLGRETDTYDIWGETLFERAVDISVDELERVIFSFLGESLQVPPMYSAKKLNGKRLYELAREGKTIERKAVPIYIEEIQIKRVDFPRVYLTISCGAGTYIRSLIQDIGKELGCGACMEELLRTRAGRFSIQEAHTLEEIQNWKDESEQKDKACPFIVPIDQGFSALPKYICRKEFEKLALNGASLYDQAFYEVKSHVDSNSNENASGILEAAKSSLVRLYLEGGKFLGIYELSGKNICPRKVFI